MARIDNIKEFIKKSDETVRSYKIGRNEPCPCGSGEKYKKCCAQIKPEKSKEYYREKIQEEDDKDKILDLLKKADKDYPLDPTFILPIVVYSLQEQDQEKASYYLRKAWRVMGPDLDDVFIMPLVNLLLQEREIERAGEIVDEARQEKGDSPHLLIAHGEVMKARGDFDSAFDDIERGLELEPSNPELIVFKLETLLDLNELLAALEVWNNRYDILKNMKGIHVLNFLQKLLQENFGLANDAGSEEIKAVLEQAIKANRYWQEIYNLLGQQKWDEVDDRLSKLRELIPANSPLTTNIMDNYNTIERYEKTIKYGDEVVQYQEDNPGFHLAVGEAYLEENEMDQAGEHLQEAFDLTRREAEKSDRDFNHWTVVGENLRFLLEKDDSDKLLDFIKEVKELVPDEESLISILQLSLDKYDLQTYPTKLLVKLNQIKDSPLIDEMELYITYLYTLLSLLDRAQRNQTEDISFMKQQLRSELDRAEGSQLKSPLVEYAELRLEAENMSESQIEEHLNNIENMKADYPQESIAQYEALLYYGEEGKILERCPQEPPLARGYVEFYLLVAAIKDENKEKAEELFHPVALREKKQGTIAQLFLRLLDYVGEDKLQRLLEEINVDNNLLNLLNEIIQYRQSRQK